MKKGVDAFTSSAGIFLALVGSAVGLGNIWRFPYMMGENGGAAFIIIYIFCAFVLAMPIMICEFVIGRRGGTNALQSFSRLAPGSKWYVTGVVGILAAFMIVSFYCVIGGWTLNYLIKSVSPVFSAQDTDFSALFSASVSNTGSALAYTFAFLAMTALIVSFGVKNGIEKSAKVMMPTLFFLMVVIAVRSLTLPGADAGLRYIFHPDFSAVTDETVIAALGQAFFSLSVGVGTVITYASYAPENGNILKCSAMTVLFDTLFALIAGCAIMPAVFAFGLDPGEGPGLAFITLPQLFSGLPFGEVVAFVFFLALLLAALSSAISIFEEVTSFAKDRFSLSRPAAVLAVFGCLLVTTTFNCLSQGVLSSWKVFGMDILGLFDYVSANILMLSGALLIVVFAGWKLSPAVLREELTNKGSIKIPPFVVGTTTFVIRYLAPVAIAAIAIYSFIQ